MGTCCSQGIFSYESLEKGDSQQWGEAEIEKQPLPGSWQGQEFQGESRGGRWEDSEPPANADFCFATFCRWVSGKEGILLVMNSKVLSTVGPLCHNCRAGKGKRKKSAGQKKGKEKLVPTAYIITTEINASTVGWKIATTTAWVNIFTSAITFQGRE